MLVLGMVARPRGELHVAQLLQLPADIGLVERDGKFVMEPLDEIDQPPANNPMDRRGRAALDNIDQCLALRIVEPRTRLRGLAIEQAVGATGIEPQHPVPHNLKSDTTDPRGRTPAPAIVNLGQSQKASCLISVLRRPR